MVIIASNSYLLCFTLNSSQWCINYLNMHYQRVIWCIPILQSDPSSTKPSAHLHVVSHFTSVTADSRYVQNMHLQVLYNTLLSKLDLFKEISYCHQYNKVCKYPSNQNHHSIHIINDVYYTSSMLIAQSCKSNCVFDL